MNRFEPSFPAGEEAEIRYGDGDFDVIRRGNFVRCSVTGKIIPLEELRYWNVDLQEAYVTADVAFARYQGIRGGK
jgi:hypothetical protein